MNRRAALMTLPLGLLAEGCALPLPADLTLPEPPWPIPAGYPQPFRTAGNRIVDGTGRPAVFRGVAVPEVVWLSQRQDDKLGTFNRDLFRAAAEWRTNIVRVSVMPAVARLQGERVTLATLDAAVAYAKRYGLYLIICFHSIGFPPDERYTLTRDPFYGDLHRTTGAEIWRFWQMVARRYAGERTVAFYELFNEPALLGEDRLPINEDSLEDWLAWKAYAERLIDAIRLVDFAKPIIVGGLQYAYDLSYAAEAPIARDNIVYATHPYAGSDWRKGWEEAFLGPARRLPVIATEFGWEPNDHPEDRHKGPGRYRDEIFEAFDRSGISWVAWAFSHSFKPKLLTDARSFQPTEYGEVVLNALIRRAPPMPPTGRLFVA